jgi:predicted TPR repeat methyltransferase
MLMQLGRHAAAQREYEQTLQREPRRARSTFGAARAAELSGNSAAARAHYTLLLEIMEKGDASRPEIAAARRFLASGR